eukprot:CAMPEP_0119007290 /NCGR_PEP_ID=MMETSP1176-20130426/2908_1 /TAXON_ID=265551 /ORGANISM="Synedropsis recta cf, Strain CCMP1620" /LENGTH=374 /DNA_ID=CAMNT_0006959405 /DNA_START=153 /DNA_END=1274 /DNA_ORIENTATION=+
MKRLLRRSSNNAATANEESNTCTNSPMITFSPMTPNSTHSGWKKMIPPGPLSVTSVAATASLHGEEDWSSSHFDGLNFDDDDEEPSESFETGGFAGASESFGDFGDFDATAALAAVATTTSLEQDVDDDDDDGFGPLTAFAAEDEMSESRRKIASNGFSWNRAKMVRMLSSRSLMETSDDEEDDPRQDEYCFRDDLSVVHSVGTVTSDYSQMSNLSETLMLDPTDHNKAVADELKELPDAEVADLFCKMQKKLARRRKKFRKSRAKGHQHSSKIDSLNLSPSRSRRDDEQTQKSSRSSKKGSSSRRGLSREQIDSSSGSSGSDDNNNEQTTTKSSSRSKKGSSRRGLTKEHSSSRSDTNKKERPRRRKSSSASH